MKLRMISSLAVFSLVVAGPSLAQCCGGTKAKGDGGAQPAAQVSQAAAQQSSCHGDKSAVAAKGGAAQCSAGALAGVPKMQCRVGDKTVNCPIEAEKLAAADHAKITYVVAEKEYTDKIEALQAYAKVLEDHLNTTTTVSYAVGDKCLNCPMAAASLAKETKGTVKYQVALVSFPTQAEADQAAKVAHDAVGKVAMKKFVDGKEVACEVGASCCGGGAKQVAAKSGGCCEKGAAVQTAGAKEAEPKAVAAKSSDGEKSCCQSGGQLASGAKTEYVVGEMRTACPVMARVQLAMARIQAAHKAVQEFASQQSGEKVALGS